MFHLDQLTLNTKQLNSNLNIATGDRIGLVGANGSGKSTLLRLINERADISIGYVPQRLILDNSLTVFDYLEGRKVDPWEVLSILNARFQFEPDPYEQVENLSGGEQMKLMLAAALWRSPQLLLLDEPTNHLDLESITKLEQLLINSNYTYVIASHDIAFLNKVTTSTLELTNELKACGGNYDFYQEQKRLGREAQQRELEVAKQKLNRINNSLQQEEIKFQTGQAKLARAAKSGDRSIPRIVRNAMKKGGQVQHGINKERLTKTAEELQSKVAQLKPQARKSIYLALNNRVQSSGLVVAFEQAELVNPAAQILITNLDFALYHGDRISIAGANGSGKSTLASQLNYESNSMVRGLVRYGNSYTTLYLDQHYQLIKPQQSLIDNLQSYGIGYEQARKHLANLGFFDISAQQAETLSGGETVRLALAIITAVQPDLLILDEPTNNLDTDSVVEITDCLESYNGTLVIISHNRQFLNDINITDQYTIKDKLITHATN